MKLRIWANFWDCQRFYFAYNVLLNMLLNIKRQLCNVCKIWLWKMRKYNTKPSNTQNNFYSSHRLYRYSIGRIYSTNSIKMSKCLKGWEKAFRTNQILYHIPKKRGLRNAFTFWERITYQINEKHFHLVAQLYDVVQNERVQPIKTTACSNVQKQVSSANGGSSGFRWKLFKYILIKESDECVFLRLLGDMNWWDTSVFITSRPACSGHPRATA